MSARYSGVLPPFTIFFDFCLLNSAFIFAGHITHIPFIGNVEPQFLLLFNFSWAAIAGLTRNFEVSRPLWLRQHINLCMISIAYHAACLFAIIYFFKQYLAHFPALIFGYALFFLFVLIYRSVLFFFLDYIRKKGYNNRRIIVIGNKHIADRLIASFENHAEYGYDLAGYFSEADVAETTEQLLFEALLSKQPDEIFICYKELNDEQLRRFISFGDDYLIKIKVVSDLILSNSYARLVTYNDLPVLQLSSQPEISLKIRILKRAFDIGFSLTALIVGLPIYLLVYVITKISSPGPAFYSQERIGLNGKPFTIYKFRSMKLNAEPLGPQLSFTNDSRSGRWGKFMRKTRLDELPQFWNVLKGEMSVVGPRPERQFFIEKIVAKTPNYKRLLRVKPGLTSAGQVNYGYAENVDQMCDRMIYDLNYLRRMNFRHDIRIIARTLKIMARREGK